MTNSRKLAFWRNPGRMVPLVIFAIALFGFAGYRMSSHSGVKRELEEIRKRGLPTTGLELDAWYEQLPPGENAALEIMKAARDRVDASPDNDPSNYSWRDVPLGEPLPPKIIAAAEDYVAKNSEMLKQLHATARLSRSRYSIDLSKVPDLSLDHLGPVRNLVQLLRWETVIKAERGDTAGAAQSLMTGFAVSASLKDEPLLISELVRIACVAILLPALERAVTAARFDEAELARLARAVRQAEEEGRHALFRAVVGERAFGIVSFNQLTYDDYVAALSFGGAPAGFDAAPEIIKKLIFNLRRAIGMHDRDMAFYIQTMGELERAARLDYPEMLREIETTVVTVAAETDAHPVRYLISGMGLLVMGSGPKKEALLAAQLRCARAALEVQRYRARNGGQLPRLNEMVPEFMEDWPRDPVDGQPLKLEGLDGKGFRIVAEAATALSNQGRSQTNGRDVAFSVAR